MIFTEKLTQQIIESMRRHMDRNAAQPNQDCESICTVLSALPDHTKKNIILEVLGFIVCDNVPEWTERYQDAALFLLRLMPVEQRFNVILEQNDQGNNLLHKAVKYGNLLAVVFILNLFSSHEERRKLIVMCNGIGSTALHYAARNPEILTALLTPLTTQERLFAAGIKNDAGKTVEDVIRDLVKDKIVSDDLLTNVLAKLLIYSSKEVPKFFSENINYSLQLNPLSTEMVNMLAICERYRLHLETLRENKLSESKFNAALNLKDILCDQTKPNEEKIKLVAKAYADSESTFKSGGDSLGWQIIKAIRLILLSAITLGVYAGLQMRKSKREHGTICFWRTPAPDEIIMRDFEAQLKIAQRK